MENKDIPSQAEGNFNWQSYTEEYEAFGNNQNTATQFFSSLIKLLPEFSQHEDHEKSNSYTENWLKSYDLWVEGRSADSLTMNCYLHPKARTDIEGLEGNKGNVLDLNNIFYSFLFSIDDMGSENANTTSDSRKKIRNELKGLAALLNNNNPIFAPINAIIQSRRNSLFKPAIEILSSYKEIADRDTAQNIPYADKWFGQFKTVLQSHLGHVETFEDELSNTLIQNIYEFFRLRIFDSGMETTEMLMQISSGMYVNPKLMTLPEAWTETDIQTDELFQSKLANVDSDSEALRVHLNRQRYLLQLIPALVNDFYSIHDETIKARSTFNFVPQLMLLDGITFGEAVLKGKEMVDELLNEFFTNQESLKGLIYHSNLPELEENNQKEALANLILVDYPDAMKATDIWQRTSPRYKTSPVDTIQHMFVDQRAA